MSVPLPRVGPSRLIEAAYSDAYQTHGDLAVSLETYAARLTSIASRLARDHPRAGDDCGVESYLTRLHTTDLYLTLACAEGNEAGWKRFIACYRRLIREFARRCSQILDPVEVADAILADLCSSDRSGFPKMASYDCRYSLVTWLRAIVYHRVTNELKRNSPAVEPLESALDVVDQFALERVETGFREGRYAEAIRGSLQYATAALNDRELLIMNLIYRKGLTRTEVAERLGVNPSTISYHERRTRDKLRDRVTSALELDYHLSKAAVSECVAEIVSNPAYSILAIIEIVEKDSKN